ncbi:MAG: ACP phosphodiesterase [Agriterribacter sp.]
MNYLAHAYLSFGHPEVLVGNMISDFVKGKQKFAFSQNIQKGIAIHRAIDAFTDAHSVTKAAKALFRPQYGLYAGAFIDIVYDHFLAADSSQFGKEGLLQFSERTYALLDRFEPVFPPRFRSMFPYMKQQNWLFNYQYKQGIQNSFRGLVHRAAYLTDSSAAFEIFEQHYRSFHKYYIDFFPEIKTFAWQQFVEAFPDYEAR